MAYVLVVGYDFEVCLRYSSYCVGEMMVDQASALTLCETMLAVL